MRDHTISVPDAGKMLGLSRSGAYDAAKRGDIPTVRVSRLVRVPIAPLHRLLGIEEPRQSGQPKEAA